MLAVKIVRIAKPYQEKEVQKAIKEVEERQQQEQPEDEQI